MKKYLLFYFLLFFIQNYFSQEARYIDTELLNVRSGPGKNYEVLDTAPKGEKVIFISTKGNWTQIQMDSGIKGFVSSKFVINTPPTSQKINNDPGKWWKVPLGIVGFLLIVKFFGSKKCSSTSSRDYSKTFKTQQNMGSNAVVETVNISSKEKPSIAPKPIQKKEKLYCKFCGREETNLFFLTSGKCQKSSSGYHMPFEGDVEKKYLCKFCGREESNLFFLTSRKCNKSTSKYHQPLI